MADDLAALGVYFTTPRSSEAPPDDAVSASPSHTPRGPAPPSPSQHPPCDHPTTPPPAQQPEPASAPEQAPPEHSPSRPEPTQQQPNSTTPSVLHAEPPAIQRTPVAPVGPRVSLILDESTAPGSAGQIVEDDGWRKSPLLTAAQLRRARGVPHRVPAVIFTAGAGGSPAPHGFGSLSPADGTPTRRRQQEYRRAAHARTAEAQTHALQEADRKRMIWAQESRMVHSPDARRAMTQWRIGVKEAVRAEWADWALNSKPAQKKKPVQSPEVPKDDSARTKRVKEVLAKQEQRLLKAQDDARDRRAQELCSREQEAVKAREKNPVEPSPTPTRGRRATPTQRRRSSSVGPPTTPPPPRSRRSSSMDRKQSTDRTVDSSLLDSHQPVSMRAVLLSSAPSAGSTPRRMRTLSRGSGSKSNLREVSPRTAAMIATASGDLSRRSRENLVIDEKKEDEKMKKKVEEKEEVKVEEKKEEAKEETAEQTVEEKIEPKVKPEIIHLNEIDSQMLNAEVEELKNARTAAASRRSKLNSLLDQIKEEERQQASLNLLLSQTSHTNIPHIVETPPKNDEIAELKAQLKSEQQKRIVLEQDKLSKMEAELAQERQKREDGDRMLLRLKQSVSDPVRRATGLYDAVDEDMPKLLNECDGWWVEEGKRKRLLTWMDDVQTERAVDEGAYMTAHFVDREHAHLCGNAAGEPAVITIAFSEEQLMAVVRTKHGHQHINVPWPQGKKKKLPDKKEVLKLLDLSWNPKEFVFIRSKDEDGVKLTAELLRLEERFYVPRRCKKFGVLYVKQGQSNEEDFWENGGPGSEDFETFLAFLGQRIRLKGWEKYRGGLDVRADTMGEYSHYTAFEGIEIMYHISTMLPMHRTDPSRKRHIGNDMVCIVFIDQPTDGNPPPLLPFVPASVKSHFLHAYCVVRKADNLGTNGSPRFQMAFAGKLGLPGPIPPEMPDPAVFELNDEFRGFLLSKLVTAEERALESPLLAFKDNDTRTRNGQLKVLVEGYI